MIYVNFLHLVATHSQRRTISPWPIVLAMFAAACVTSKPVMAPDGTPGFYIQCPRDVSVCMDEAQRLCPAGYHVIGSGHSVANIQQTNAQVFGSNGYATGQSTTTTTPVYRGNMTITCRDRDTE